MSTLPSNTGSELVFITKKRNAFILPYFATFLFQHLINFTTLGSKSGSRTKQSSDPSKASAVHLARSHQAQEIFSKVMKKKLCPFCDVVMSQRTPERLRAQWWAGELRDPHPASPRHHPIHWETRETHVINDNGKPICKIFQCFQLRAHIYQARSLLGISSSF